MFTRIHNVVIAVKNAEEAAKQYKDNFGLRPSQSGPVPELGIKMAQFTLGESLIELIEPLVPQQGPVAKFLETRGEGLYMIELEVENVPAAVQALTKKGVRLLGADPASLAKGGRVFIHPQSSKGVLIQLVPKA